MKNPIIVSTVFCTVLTFSHAAFAAGDMGGMKMEGSGTMAPAKPDASALTDAVIKKVDPPTGMVTIQHGPLVNVGMPAMTMAFKAKDESMLKQAKEGQKVKVRVENVEGTMTIVTLLPQ